MAALARGQSSGCANPVLDLYTLVGSVRTDMHWVAFEIYEKVDLIHETKVYPLTPGPEELDLALCPTGQKINTGHYVAPWTPPLIEPTGTHLIKWHFKLTPSSGEVLFCEEFEVLPEAHGETSLGYCSIQDCRDEGVTVEVCSDARLQTLITRASIYIDRWTGRFFSPREQTYTFDGTNAQALLLEQPIIAIASVAIQDSAIDESDMKVYNRHITQGLLDPDDRENPRIELIQPITDIGLKALGLVWYPKGQLNVTVQGIFGYTDYDGTQYGCTPPLIVEACKLLVMKFITPYFTAGGLDDQNVGYKIINQQTREQKVQFADPNKLGLQAPGPFTGDNRIDSIILMYRRPPRLRSV